MEKKARTVQLCTARTLACRAALTVLALTALTGCYKYTPVEEGVEVIRRGESMRVALTQPIEVDLGSITVNDAVAVRGEFIQQEEDGTIVLAAFGTTSPTGAEMTGDGKTVRIPLDAVSGVERKTMDAGATALTVGAIAGGAVAIGVTALSGGEGGGDSGGPGGEPPQQ
jgi:hypothetical protein